VPKLPIVESLPNTLLQRGFSMNRFFRPLAALVTLLAVSAPFASVAHADTKEVVIAYQDMVLPWRYAQATGEVEKETGYKVVYRQLSSGAEVVRALASGPVRLRQACRRASTFRCSGFSTTSTMPKHWWRATVRA